jgi:hypothetical protein
VAVQAQRRSDFVLFLLSRCSPLSPTTERRDSAGRGRRWTSTQTGREEAAVDAQAKYTATHNLFSGPPPPKTRPAPGYYGVYAHGKRWHPSEKPTEGHAAKGMPACRGGAMGGWEAFATRGRGRCRSPLPPYTFAPQARGSFKCVLKLQKQENTVFWYPK